MLFNDLTNGLAKILKNSFPTYKIYSEEIRQGIKRPALHINVMPLASNNFNKYYREQRALVDISFFSDESPDLQSNLSNLTIANVMQNALNTELKILDRSINLQELEYEAVDGIFHTTFNLMWYNRNEVTEAYLAQFPKVQKVIINSEVFGNSCLFITNNGDVYKTSEGGFYTLCTSNEVVELRNAGYITL